MKKFIAISTFLVLTAGQIRSQAQCPCCSEPHQQFDFWIGDWVVRDTTGTKVGSSKISKIENGCVILEQWTGATATTGTSMNFYDPKDASWNQLWLDNNGSILKLKGRFKNERMVLQSDLVTRDSISYYDRITWHRNKNGEVVQLWERYTEQHLPLATLFKGIYTKEEE